MVKNTTIEYKTEIDYHASNWALNILPNAIKFLIKNHKSYHLCLRGLSGVHKGGVFKLRVEDLKDIEESLMCGSSLSAQLLVTSTNIYHFLVGCW